MIVGVTSEAAMRAFGAKVAQAMTGGGVIELLGDVGAGKTTFVKGLASGLGISEDVQSPTFTINRLYDAPDGRQLAHYDFYRLNDAGIMTAELQDTANDPMTITVIEWADVVEDVLPADRLQIAITSPTETSRRLEITSPTSILESL